MKQKERMDGWFDVFEFETMIIRQAFNRSINALGTNKLYIYKKYSKWNQGNNSKKTNIHTKTDNHCTLLDSTVNNIYISSVISINLIELRTSIWIIFWRYHLNVLLFLVFVDCLISVLTYINFYLRAHGNKVREAYFWIKQSSLIIAILMPPTGSFTKGDFLFWECHH